MTDTQEQSPTRRSSVGGTASAVRRPRAVVQTVVVVTALMLSLSSPATATTVAEGRAISPPVVHGVRLDPVARLLRLTDGDFLGLADTNILTPDSTSRIVFIIGRVQLRVFRFDANGHVRKRFLHSPIGRGILVGRPGEYWDFTGPIAWRNDAVLVHGWTAGDLSDAPIRRPRSASAIIAFNPRTGRLLRNFGRNGIVMSRQPKGSYTWTQPNALLPLNGNSLLECGRSEDGKPTSIASGLLRELDLNGAAGTGFAALGPRRIPASSGIINATCSAIAGDQSGRVYIAGFDANDRFASDPRMWVERYNADGTLDSTYGVNGQFRFDALPGGSSSRLLPTGLQVLPGGGVYVTGRISPDFISPSFIVRLTPAGTIDPTYGSGGEVLIDQMRVRTTVLNQDGSLVLGGEYGKKIVRPALGRLLPNGAWDTSFSGTGLRLYTRLGGTFGTLIPQGTTVYAWGAYSLAKTHGQINLLTPNSIRVIDLPPAPSS